MPLFAYLAKFCWNLRSLNARYFWVWFWCTTSLQCLQGHSDFVVLQTALMQWCCWIGCKVGLRFTLDHENIWNTHEFRNSKSEEVDVASDSHIQSETVVNLSIFVFLLRRQKRSSLFDFQVLWMTYCGTRFGVVNAEEGVLQRGCNYLILFWFWRS